MRLRHLIAGVVLALAGCAAPEGPGPQAPATDAAGAPLEPPAFPRLGAALPAGHTAYDNASLAQLFATLALETEWDASRPHLVRFEEPVSVALEGPGAQRYAPFLDGFLTTLRAEADVRITRDRPANLTVRFIEGRRFESALRTAACVTAQGEVAWDDYAGDPTGHGADALARARALDRMTIFIPDTAPPYLARNCLLEEIPQALGLANDLYGLGSSSFNDDGAHLWPTKLDYLMLRVLYAPGMRTGLSRRQSETRALALLERLNPEGIGAPPLPHLRRRALGDWPRLMTAVFSRGVGESDVRRMAEEALRVVEAYAPQSAQHCHTLVTAGRVLSRSDPRQALRLFDEAETVCEAAHGVSDIRQARIRLERACALQRLGRDTVAAEIAEATWPVLAAHGQDERLAALYTIQADALARAGADGPRAEAAARLAGEWTAYALGPGRRAAHCQADA